MVLNLVLQISVALWFLAEIALRGRSRSHWAGLGLILLTAAFAGFFARLVGQALPALHFSAVLPVVLLLLWLGVGFRLWALATQRRGLRGGPRRVVRHPSYAGALLAAFGLSLLFGNIASVLVFMSILLLGVLYRMYVEERLLLDGLGRAYANYMRETSRLIPGVW